MVLCRVCHSMETQRIETVGTTKVASARGKCVPPIGKVGRGYLDFSQLFGSV